jgi:hypothetical protein
MIKAYCKNWVGDMFTPGKAYFIKTEVSHQVKDNFGNWQELASYDHFFEVRYIDDQPHAMPGGIGI